MTKELSKVISDLEIAMKVINSQDMNNMRWNSTQGWVNSALSALKNMESSSRIINSFICVKDQTPPKNTELIAQDSKGVNHLTTWRESYNIFTCQNKTESSLNWKWKQI